MHILDRAYNSGIQRLIITGTTLQDSQEAIQLATTTTANVHLTSTVGCHPTRCNEPETQQGYFDKLRQLIRQHRDTVVAIGECGLDYDRLQFCPRDVQLRHFVPHFTLAHEFGLPLFLHCRNAASDFVRIVREHRTKFVHAVVHSFDGTLSELQDMLDLGLHIGINGCSLKTQENLDVAAQIPLDRLLLETGMRQYT